ncbi:ashwin [Gadus morhua]|uniref:ashwin n=1 Tax=Gadus morhua TaxID=8049 RepID=UPI0011B4718D|nr:ashwin [Gadus morhua]
MLGNIISKMASSMGPESTDKSACNTDLLLHPELLSKEFMKLLLNEKKIYAGEGDSVDGLTSLYLRHVIPLPQRALPNTRWGKRMEERRSRHTSDHQLNRSKEDFNRKRPPIVFSGSSHCSNPVKVRKTDSPAVATGCTDRLKPPPTTNVSNPIRKLSSPSPSSSYQSTLSSPSETQTSNLKRESDNQDALNSPDLKKKIHHVTWP